MKNILLPLATALVIFVSSCKKNDTQNPLTNDKPLNSTSGALSSAASALGTPCTAVTTVDLVNSNGKQIGTVEISNNAAFYTITYNTLPGFTLKQTHLYVGSCSTLPFNNGGNPQFNQFQYKKTHINDTTYTYTTNVSDIGLGNCGCIVAYAEVKNKKGKLIDTYGFGNPVPGSDGAYSISSCPCVDPPQD